jgi:hypothetical protein
MRLLKGGVLPVMTGETQLQGGQVEKIYLLRGVGLMAGPAPFILNDAVHHLLVELFLLMTGKTHLTAFRGQQVGGIGSVGIMAGDAFSPPQGRMHPALPVQLQILFLVAEETEIVALLLQQQFGHDTMGKVTFLTFVLFHHGVHIFHAKIFFGKITVAVRAFLFLKGSLPGVGGRGKIHLEQGYAHEGNRYPEDDFSFFHASQHNDHSNVSEEVTIQQHRICGTAE